MTNAYTPHHVGLTHEACQAFLFYLTFILVASIDQAYEVPLACNLNEFPPPSRRLAGAYISVPCPSNDTSYISNYTYASPSPYYPSFSDDNAAMATLSALWGAYLPSWGAGSYCSGAWQGVTCYQGRVSGIRLRTNEPYGINSMWEISSTVPSALGSLTRLTSLELVGLGLFGFLPPEIGRLTELTTLVMATYVNYNVNDNAYSSSCQYTNMYPGTSTIWLTDNGNGISYLNGYPGSLLLLGGIPSSWGALTNLRTLNISLGGCLGLPVVINRFYSDVNYGTFNSTNLSGDFQEALGSLTSLRHLDLRGNQFLCGLPTTIGRLSNLTALIASGNRLAGVLPSEMGRLRALSLLDLASNRLNGCARAARTRRHARTVDLGVCDDGGRRDSETASG